MTFMRSFPPRLSGCMLANFGAGFSMLDTLLFIEPRLPFLSC
jgi:hypothetical protein